MDYEKIRSLMETKFDKVDKIVSITSEEDAKKDDLYYITNITHKMFKYMLECHQEIDYFDKPTRVRRLLKINKIIALHTLSIYTSRIIHVKRLAQFTEDFVTFGGLYLVCDCWMFPIDGVHEWMNDNDKYTGHVGYHRTDEYNLPKEQDIISGTIKVISNKTGLAISRGFIDNMIETASMWDYVFPEMS